MGVPTCSIALQNVSVVDLTAFELPKGRKEIKPSPDGSYIVPLSGGRTIFLAPNQKSGTFDFKCDPLPCQFTDLRFIRHAIGLPKSVFLADVDHDGKDDVVVSGEKHALVIQGNDDARPAGVVCKPAQGVTQDLALASIAKKDEAEEEDRFLAAEHIQESGIHDDALLSVIIDQKLGVQGRLSYMSNLRGEKAIRDAYAAVVKEPALFKEFQSKWPRLFDRGDKPEKRNTNLPTCLIARGNGSLMKRSEFVMPKERKKLEVDPLDARYCSYRIFMGDGQACFPLHRDCNKKAPLIPLRGVLAPLRVLNPFLGCSISAFWADVDGHRDPDLIVAGEKYVAVIQHGEDSRPDNVVCNPAKQQDQDQMLASVARDRGVTIGDRWLMWDNISEGKQREDLILSALEKNKDIAAEERQIMLRYLPKGTERDKVVLSLMNERSIDLRTRWDNMMLASNHEVFKEACRRIIRDPEFFEALRRQGTCLVLELCHERYGMSAAPLETGLGKRLVEISQMRDADAAREAYVRLVDDPSFSSRLFDYLTRETSHYCLFWDVNEWCNRPFDDSSD